MKKAAALILSVLFYIGAFALAFIYASEQNLLYFAYILPPVVALYFVIAANIFAHRLGLNRWLLWFVLNFAGGICSWGILIACFPHILLNGFILFYLVPVTIAFVMVWAAVGIGILCVQLWKRRADSPDTTGQPPVATSKRVGAGMEKFTGIVRVIGIMGLILSIAFLSLGVKGIAIIRPASDYEDMGVHTFSPYKVLPHTVENSATGRDKRINPTKTVYVVYYQTSDGTDYQWKVETGNSKNDANQILAARGSVERRVLSIKENGKYMTVDAELTADTYVAGQQQRYLWMVGLSGGYLVLCFMMWVAVKRRRRNNNTGEHR